MTALYAAAERGHIEVVKLLLDRHANIEAVNGVSQNVSIASTYCISLHFVLYYVLVSLLWLFMSILLSWL